MPNSSHTIREELTGIGVFIGAIWGVFALSYAFPSLDSYGIVPRTAGGLVGIVAAPFLHENLGHIVSNTVPLFILLVLLAGSPAWAGPTDQQTASNPPATTGQGGQVPPRIAR